MKMELWHFFVVSPSKNSSSFNVKKKSNSEIILLRCVLLNRIQKYFFSCAFYFGIPIIGLWLVLGLGLDGQNVGHFLITIQKSFKLIIN